MNAYLLLKTIHIMSSVLLVGTGLGSAFYLFFANRSGSLAAQAVVARYVVLADWLFTTPTIIIQPLTGFAMMHIAGMSWTTPWILWTLALYALACACWLPVVWLQMRLRDLAAQAAREGAELPPLYWKYFRTWVALGIPAFIAFVYIFWLMVSKPV